MVHYVYAGPNVFDGTSKNIEPPNLLYISSCWHRLDYAGDSKLDTTSTNQKRTQNANIYTNSSNASKIKAPRDRWKVKMVEFGRSSQ